MANADAGRDYAKRVKCLHAPLQETISLGVPLKFVLQILAKCLRHTRYIDLHRMVHHEIDGHQRLDDRRILSEPGHSRPHSGEIDEQWDTGKVLQQNSSYHERYFIGPFRVWLPVR